MMKLCYEEIENRFRMVLRSFRKKRLLAAKGGRKTKIPEPRITLIEGFMDVRTSLNAKLPRDLFL